MNHVVKYYASHNVININMTSTTTNIRLYHQL